MANSSSYGTQHARQEIERAHTKSIGWPICIGIAVVTVVLVAFGYRWAAHRMARTKIEFQTMDLDLLELALKMYETKFGEYPPNPNWADIEKHVRRAFTLKPTFDLHKVAFPHDLSTMDDWESIPFWLGAAAWSSITDDRDISGFVMFDDRNLTDRDGDGWPEYLNDIGNFLVLRDGKVFAYDPKKQATYSKEDLEGQLDAISRQSSTHSWW